MTTAVMADSAFPPTVPQALAVAHAYGVTAWAGYFPWGAAYRPEKQTEYPWSPQNFHALRDAGFRTCGLLVPPQSPSYYTGGTGLRDGTIAAAYAQLCDVDIAGVDIERGMYDGNPSGVLAYLASFTPKLQASHAFVIEYIPVNAVEPRWQTSKLTQPDGVWVPNYDNPVSPDPRHIPLVPDSAFPLLGQRGWQYRNQVTVGGVTVDLSVIDWAAAPKPSPPPRRTKPMDLTSRNGTSILAVVGPRGADGHQHVYVGDVGKPATDLGGDALRVSCVYNGTTLDVVAEGLKGELYLWQQDNTGAWHGPTLIQGTATTT